MENCTNDNALPLSTIDSFAFYFFWGLFGYFEIAFLTSDENSPFVKAFGTAMIGTFHIVMILILLNMLIVIMTKSCERTDENKDIEWNFIEIKFG